MCIDFYKHLVHGTSEKSANFSGLLTRLKMHQKIALMGRRWFKSRETSATATSGQELCVEHFAQTSWCYLTGFHPDKSQICYQLLPKKGFQQLTYSSYIVSFSMFGRVSQTNEFSCPGRNQHILPKRNIILFPWRVVWNNVFWWDQTLSKSPSSFWNAFVTRPDRLFSYREVIRSLQVFLFSRCGQFLHCRFWLVDDDYIESKRFRFEVTTYRYNSNDTNHLINLVRVNL